MSDDHSSNLSDEEDEIETGVRHPELQGSLSKWTNYIHGWQDRYIVLKDGTLAYYKSETDTSYGCRGAISICKAVIKPHEFDECRFDVSVNDCVWYLRTNNLEERNRWVETLDSYKLDSAYGSENSLRRHGSAISVGSTSLSGASVSSFKKARGLREKLAEMETFRDILCQQVDTLQSYFDSCAELSSNVDENTIPQNEIPKPTVPSETGQTPAPDIGPSPRKSNFIRSFFRRMVDDIEEDYVEEGTLRESSMMHLANQQNDSPIHRYKEGHPSIITKDLLMEHGAQAVDFKGEAITFKATTSGILATLSHCIELLSQREDSWKRRLDKEMDRRRKLEDAYRQVISEATIQKTVVVGGPDYEEGPHSVINEEEFFDAVDAALEKSEQQEEDKRIIKNRAFDLIQPEPSAAACKHSLWPEIEHVTLEQLKYAKMGVGEGGWQLFAEDGEMRMYRREVEEGGVVCDPLKAVHTVKGVTGHEMCHYFFMPEVRFDWETTLENMKVIEEIDTNTLVFHQVHKRVWPATQRDALFWSHVRRVPNDEDQDAHDIWIVCNNTTEHESMPVGKCVRVVLTVSLVCQTFVDPPSEDQEITRDNLTCRITYCSNINPGGWAPASVLRAVYKREYPKFLKRFTQYVKDMTESKPIMF